MDSASSNVFLDHNSSPLRPARFRSVVTLLAIALCSGVFFSFCGKKTPFPGAALANPTGTITMVPAKGEPYRLTEEMLFRPAGLLLEGDTVRTAANSRVDLQFPAGLVMRLGADSAVKLSKGKILSGDNFGEVLMDLKRGRLMTRKQKFSNKSRVVIRTPTLIASVRGTEFLVKADGASGEVLVQEGTVVVHGPGTPGSRDIEEPPVPGGSDAEDPSDPTDPPAPEDPGTDTSSEENAEEPIDDPFDTLDEDVQNIVNGQDVDEGNKIEVVDESENPDESDVSELDEDDREELEEMSDGLDYMDAQGLEQIESIMQSFEEAKAEIGEAVQEQREKNRELINSERTRMKDEFEAQKDAIRGEGEVKDAQGNAQSELDRIKNMQ